MPQPDLIILVVHILVNLGLTLHCICEFMRSFPVLSFCVVLKTKQVRNVL